VNSNEPSPIIIKSQNKAVAIIGYEYCKNDPEEDYSGLPIGQQSRKQQ